LARNIAWGIDIGESAIKAVRLCKIGDSVVVQDYRTVPCETRPEDAQGGDRDARIRNALATLQREVKLKGASVAVSMPGRDVFPRFISLPPVEKKRIPELVRYEARTQMPFPIEEVIWDYQPLAEEVTPGEEVEVALFAIKRATVYTFLDSLASAGLQPDLVEICPLALYNFLMYDRPVETGTVIIDIGAENTDLVVMDGERFWTRNVSISGNDITRALQEKYQVSFEEAENLKRKTASTKQAEKLFGVMRPILDDLIGEIQRSIGYYKAQSRNVRIEQIVLLGNAFKLRGLIDYFRKSLDYEVSLLDSLRRVKLGAESDQRKFEAELPNYGVAIGLALQALGQGRVNIDLMPPEVVRNRVLRRKVPWVAAAVAMLALPIGLGFVAVGRQAKGVTYELPGVERRIKELEEIEREIKDLANNDTVEKQLKDFVGVGAKRNQWVGVIDKLNKAFADIPRDRFLVVKILEVGAAERGRKGAQPPPEFTAEMMMEGMEPPPDMAGPPPDEKKDDEEEEPKEKPLTVEIQFEKKGRPQAGDVEDLLSKFEQEGILLAQSRGVKRASEKDRSVVRTRAVGVVAEEYYIFTVWVTFGKKPKVAAKPPDEGAEPPQP